MTIHNIGFTAGANPRSDRGEGAVSGTFGLRIGSTATLGITNEREPMGKSAPVSGWVGSVSGAPECKNMVFASTAAAEATITKLGGSIL
jgi:hypothetical protein